MLIFIFSFIPFILDYIFNLFMPYLSNNLSIFNTCFTIVTIALIYPLFKENKNYLIFLIFYGIIYDLFFTGLFVYDGLIFLLLGLITIYFNSNLENNYINTITYILFLLFIYFGIYSSFMFIFNVVPINFYKFIYIFIHSILSNVIYSTIIYLIIYKLSEDKKKRKYIR